MIGRSGLLVKFAGSLARARCAPTLLRLRNATSPGNVTSGRVAPAPGCWRVAFGRLALTQVDAAGQQVDLAAIGAASIREIPDIVRRQAPSGSPAN
jgi:hypothetical protein